MKQGYVFPGQGSQTVGMLQDIALQFPIVEQTFKTASSVLDYDLWEVVKFGPAEELDKTEKTQPALLTASFALWRILSEHNKLQPALLAGHSLGEYTALVCANSIRFEDAVHLVAKRGEFMQQAVPLGQGALAAIVGLDDLTVDAICKVASENDVLSAANFNSPGQVVIAGNTAAIDRALVLAKEKGAKIAKKLSVSVPSHCFLMQPAAEQLAEFLAKMSIQAPTIPVINNVDVKPYTDANSIRDGLMRQLFMPVRWVETIDYFAKQGITEIIEVGPGKVLSGLIKRMHPDISLKTTHDNNSVNALLTETM